MADGAAQFGWLGRWKDSAVQSSIPLYNRLAADYEAHFSVPHRRAYDDLAWDFTRALLPPAPATVIDAGCGTGRWAARLVSLGYTVIGIEQAPAMASAARANVPGAAFQLVEGSMEEVTLPEGQAEMLLVMGSLQYTLDPEATLARMVQWVRPGSPVVVLVDSLVALVMELLAAGKTDEALLRLATRQGRWVQEGVAAENHLFDSRRLQSAMCGAGLHDVTVRGLLVGASALGRQRLLQELTEHPDQQLAIERRLAEEPLLVDLGKQLLAWGRRA